MLLDFPKGWQGASEGFLIQEVNFARQDMRTAADYTYIGSGLYMQAREREEITCQVGAMTFVRGAL